MILRAAIADDEAAVLRLIEELFEPPGRRPAGFSSERATSGFQHAVAEPHADVLLALDGEAAVGLASVYAEFPSIRFGRRCWLEDLVVTASRRGEGIGRRLLEAAIEWGRAHGCSHLELSSAVTRGDAHRFYLANGLAQDALLFGRLLR